MAARVLRRALWALLPLTVLWLAYGPDLGHGFLKDDFAWIAGSRVGSPSDALALFSKDNGFYRPVVGLSFALDEWRFGLEPHGYAVTNLVLVVACMAGIFRLAAALGMAWPYGLLAASVWGLNPHGIAWTILWISGRTSLLLVLSSLLAAVGVLRGRPAAAALGCLLALLSKEEAVLLPAVLTAWAGFPPEPGARWNARRATRLGIPLLVALGLYAALRSRTGAVLPWNAPGSYAPTFAPSALVRNVLEYADRACSLGLAVVLVASLLLGRWPRPDARERRWIVLGLVWLVGGYALTVFLPLRSPLYSCFPSVGAAIGCAAAVHALWRTGDARRARWLVAVAVVVPFALVPVYRSRNVGMARSAAFSTRVLAALEGAEGALAAGDVLVLHDAPGESCTLADSFGTLIQDAVRLRSGVPTARVWVEPPPGDWRRAGLEPPGDRPAVLYRVSGGCLGRLAAYSAPPRPSPP